jgi:hypothetical protein
MVTAFAIAATLAGGCETPSSSGPTYGALEGEVARVGDATVGAALVEQVAHARGLLTPGALDALVEDALVAQGARAKGLDRDPDVVWKSTAARARVVPRLAWDEARAEGQPTPDELAHLHVVHAVVLRSPRLSEASALFAARAIADAVANARTGEEFLERAKVASSAVRASVEALPAFDAGGRMDNGSLLDPDFTAAAFSLHTVGETTPIIETQFGWHVIRLVARDLPPEGELEHLRGELGDAVLALRARGRLARVLRARREHTVVELSAGADEVLARLATPP